MQKQWSDEFAKKAREHSYRARSAYKLLEMNEKYKFIHPGESYKADCSLSVDLMEFVFVISTKNSVSAIKVLVLRCEF